MERTPIEVWQRIFAFSCVDGGRTGCSLSLASKAFHDLSRRYRYYSVTLKGLKAALKFAQILDKHPRQDLRSQGAFSTDSVASSPTAPISIHHLHVTDQPPYAYPEPNPPTLKARAVSSFTRKIAQRIYKRSISPPKDIVQVALAHDPTQSLESLMHAVLHTILRGAAPTLQTLSLSVAFQTHVPAIPPLPVLTELTLHYAFGGDIHCMCCVTRTLEAPLPALRMLDLLGLRCHGNPEEVFYQATAMVGQNLTHVCLPVINASNILHMQQEQGDEHVLWGDIDIRVAGLAVHMQADPWHDRMEAALPHDEWRRRLDALDRKASRGGGRVTVVLTPRETAVGECYEEQEDNWRERVMGGRGRWIVPQRTQAECNSRTSDDI